MKMSCKKPLLDARDMLGEGPHWSHTSQCLYRVDILAPAVLITSADGYELKRMDMPEPVGAVVPCLSGELLVALSSGIYLRNEQGQLSLLADPESDRPGNRFNDGKCDSQGRFWIGSMSMDGSPNGAGALWRIAIDGSATKMLDDVHLANGLGWSPDDSKFYFTDSGRSRIDVIDFDIENGELGERRLFVEVTDGGVPDGLAVDAEGFVWSARWDGGCVVRYDPDGVMERTVKLPVPRPTSCTFGGKDGKTLFITSARVGLSAADLQAAPASGGLFAIDVPTAGLSENLFGRPVCRRQ